MRRREFITGLASAAAWPCAATAQRPTAPIIGLLVTGSADPNAIYVAALRKGQGEMGFVESQNISIEYRYGQNDIPTLTELAINLVRRRVAVIATPGGPAPVRAAKAASATTPIVFETGGDPVSAGLVASLNRPGGTRGGVAKRVRRGARRHLVEGGPCQPARKNRAPRRLTMTSDRGMVRASSWRFAGQPVTQTDLGCNDSEAFPPGDPMHPAWCAQACGIIGADARPNWKEPPRRETLTRVQWRS
jgi:hypothetical protein